MDFTPDEVEQMAAGMNRFSNEPPVTSEETGDDLLTWVFRIIQEAGGHLDQLTAHYAPDSRAVSYAGREFARYGAERGSGTWIEFRMYPALRAKYGHDPRFAAVSDKEAEYWRVTLSRPQEINTYRDVIVDETL